MELNERETIQDTALLVKVRGRAGDGVRGVRRRAARRRCAGADIAQPTRHYLASVEWETLLFFAGLFIMVGALVHTGVIGGLAGLVTDATGGNALLAVMLILVVSAIDNIPFVATMSPLVLELSTTIDNPVHAEALWWSLALGADFGGNLTAAGASANVVVIGIAKRAGTPISFWEFTRKGAVVTLFTIALAAPYLWLRYFVLV